MHKLAIALVASVSLVGCGPPALTCQMQTCSSSAKTYQLCVNVDGSDTFNFGGMSCHSAAGNSAQIEACQQQINAYCGNGGGGTGGTGGGGSGGGGGGGAMACTYTVSGAQTGSGTCNAMAAYDSSKSNGVSFVVTAGSTLSFAATLTGQTMLTAGTFGNGNAAPGYGAEWLFNMTSAYVMCSTAQNCNNNPPQGSFTLTVTNPGPSSTGAGSTSTLWSAPQGTLSLTLPAQPGGLASGTVNVSVTL